MRISVGRIFCSLENSSLNDVDLPEDVPDNWL
jgi:hypothetical protein